MDKSKEKKKFYILSLFDVATRTSFSIFKPIENVYSPL